MKTLFRLSVLSYVLILARCTPSVIIVDADPYDDAGNIHAAVHPPGTDETELRRILPHRSCADRLDIKEAYYYLFHDDIARRLGEDTSGTYEQILRDCFLCGEFLMASFFERAITEVLDFFTAEKSVIEILVTHSDNAQKKKDLLGAYEKMYGRSIEHDVRKYLSGDFENVLLEILARDRADIKGCDYKKAHDMAVALNDEVEHWGNHRQVLDTVTMNTAFDQANAIFNEFKKLTGYDLIHVIANKMKYEKANAYEDLIHYIATYSNNHIEYYSTRLKEAVDGPGTDEQTLDRIILAHAEYDMKEIEDQFYVSYHRTLQSKIARDTSEAYENFLKEFLTKSSKDMTTDLLQSSSLGITKRGNQVKNLLAGQQPDIRQGFQTSVINQK